MRVLHVVDGVLHRLPAHGVEVDGRRLVDRAHQREQARRVGPDGVDQLVERHVLARPFRHPTADERDELAEFDLQPARVDAERGDAGPQTRHLAVVVGAEDVDHAIEPPGEELVPVIGDVPGEVGPVSGRGDKDTVAVVAVLARGEPGRPVFVVDEALGAQDGDRLLDLAALLDGGLAVPLVVDDSEAPRVERMFSTTASEANRPAAAASSGPSYWAASSTR